MKNVSNEIIVFGTQAELDNICLRLIGHYIVRKLYTPNDVRLVIEVGGVGEYPEYQTIQVWAFNAILEALL